MAGTDGKFVNREEREHFSRWMQAMAKLDRGREGEEVELERILESFHVRPSTELKESLLQWKVKGWRDVQQWRTQP